MRRIFLLACLLPIMCMSFPSTPGFAQATLVKRGMNVDTHLARDVFKELVEINTTPSFGSTMAAEAMFARLQSAGFAEDALQLLGPDPRHMNLVVRFRGTGERRPILFIAHLDVVEALRQDWSVDPFTFLEKGGYYYGRGTTDDKCDDAAFVTSLIRLHKEGLVPRRDIIVALTADEENGNANGVQWLVANHRELIDAEFGINPDGGGGELKNGNHRTLDVQTCEKIYSDYRLEVTNKGGHSSLPVKENAIYRLARALTRIAAYDFPIRLNETTQKFFARSAVFEQGQIRSDMVAIGKATLDSVAAYRLSQSSPYYNALMRTTCVATMLSGGHAENALPQSARANINCRMLPDDSPDNVMATLTAVVADSQVAITRLYVGRIAPRSPLRTDLLELLERLTASRWPGTVVTPVMSTGATDGKYLRLAGIPVYGVSGMFGDIDDVRAHGKDERIGVVEFAEGVEFMYSLMKTLASGS